MTKVTANLEKRYTAYMLRQSGKLYREIGSILNVSTSRAQQLSESYHSEKLGELNRKEATKLFNGGVGIDEISHRFDMPVDIMQHQIDFENELMAYYEKLHALSEQYKGKLKTPEYFALRKELEFQHPVHPGARSRPSRVGKTRK